MKLAKNMGKLHCPMCPAKLLVDDVTRLVSEEVQESLKATVRKGMEAIFVPRIEKDYGGSSNNRTSGTGVSQTWLLAKINSLQRS